MKCFTAKDVADLKALIGQTLSRKKYTDHHEVVEKYGVNGQYPYHRHSDFVKDKIHELLRCEDSESNITPLRQYRSVLYWDHIFNGENSIYHRFVSLLHSFIGGEAYFKSLSFKSEWLEAFDISCIPVSLNDEDRDRQIYSEERNSGVLGAARRLRSKYAVFLNGDSFVLGNGEEFKIRADIAKKINSYGALRFVKHLLCTMAENDKPFEGRYYQSVRPPFEAMYCREPLPKYPYSYLVNVALGQISSSRTSGGGNPKDFEFAMDLARDYLAILNVEVYTELERALVDKQKILKLITDQVCFDFNFTIKQADPELARKFGCELFKWVDRCQFRKAHGVSLDQLLLVSNYLLSQPLDCRCLQLNSKSISKALDMDRLDAANILDLIAHDKSQLNVGYDDPLSAVRINFSEKPLIRLSQDSYVLISPLLCSLATYECAISMIRELTPAPPGKSNYADSKIGIELEDFLSGMFVKAGIKPHSTSRKYKYQGKIYDCDLILSNNEYIVIFELKKKALTRSAVSKDPTLVVSDLVQTLLKSQLQLGIQNLCLNENGEIVFEDNEAPLERGQRTVMRVAVTMFDWGDLQNRLVSDAILNHNHIESICSGQGVDGSVIKVMTELRSTYTALRNDEPNLRNVFMNSIFLGIPHISHMLQSCSGIDDFINMLYQASRTPVQGCDFFQAQNFRNTLMKK